MFFKMVTCGCEQPACPILRSYHTSNAKKHHPTRDGIIFILKRYMLKSAL